MRRRENAADANKAPLTPSQLKDREAHLGSLQGEVCDMRPAPRLARLRAPAGFT